jgi:hypothetical protein
VAHETAAASVSAINFAKDAKDEADVNPSWNSRWREGWEEETVGVDEEVQEQAEQGEEETWRFGTDLDENDKWFDDVMMPLGSVKSRGKEGNVGPGIRGQVEEGTCVHETGAQDWVGGGQVVWEVVGEGEGNQRTRYTVVALIACWLSACTRVMAC